MKKWFINYTHVNPSLKMLIVWLTVATLLLAVPCMGVPLVVLSNLFFSAATAGSVLLVALNIPLTVPHLCPLNSSMSSIVIVFLLSTPNSEIFSWKTVLFLTAFSMLSEVLSSTCFTKIIKRKNLLPASFVYSTLLEWIFLHLKFFMRLPWLPHPS